MKKMICAIIILSAAACRDLVTFPDRSDQDAIQIAFFSELMEVEPADNAEAYCVSVGPWTNRQDPSDDVIGDLREVFGIVEPASACVVTDQGTTFEGDPAGSYHIESITQTGVTATVVGYLRISSMASVAYEARIEKQGALWVVTQMTPLDTPHA
jgi:hypothetical protein